MARVRVRRVMVVDMVFPVGRGWEGEEWIVGEGLRLGG